MEELTNKPVGQMTIFYSGKVIVYDDISGDKVMGHHNSFFFILKKKGSKNFDGTLAVLLSKCSISRQEL